MAALHSHASSLSVVITALLGLGACGPDKPPPEAPLQDAESAMTDRSVCSTERASKVGITFVHICAPLAPDAFWIAATPLHCSPGEHATLECPLATSLLVEPDVPLTLLPPVTALLTDAVTAHRTCAMRFGGRLPTPAERRELRRTQGLTALIATAETDGRVRLDELDEWTASGDCDNPSKPGAGCRFERFPGAAAPPIEWPAMRRCVARAARPGRLEPAISIGGHCPVDGACRVRSPWFPTPEAEPLVHELACAPLTDPLPHPEPRPDVAAFRCVLPRGALTPSR